MDYHSLISPHIIRGFHCRYLHIAKPQAPTLVCLLGAMQTLEGGGFYHQTLSEQFNYYCVELPGQGAAEAIEPSYSCTFIAECLNDFLESIRCDTLYLVACSYSTSTALEYAKHWQHKLKKMLLLGSMAKLPEETWDTLIESLSSSPRDMSKLFIDLITDERVPFNRHSILIKSAIRESIKYANTYPKHFRNNTLRLLRYEPGDLSKINTVTRVVAGQYDGFVSPERSQALARQLHHAEFIQIDECDHLFHLEKPQETKEAIRSFLIQ